MKVNVLEMVGSFHQGGSERQAIQLAARLRAATDFNVFLATLDASGVLGESVEQLGFRDVPEYKLTSFYDFNMLRQLKKAVDFIRRNRVEIVHAHDFYTNVFGMAAARLANVPVRVASKRETGGMKTANQFRMERAAFRFADAVVVNARAVETYLIERRVPARKIEVIYNGLDLKRLEAPPNLSRADICERFDLPAGENKKFVVVVANLRHAVKNQEMFLRAAQTVKSAVADAEFVLAGEGGRRAALEKLAAELGIADSCHFTGRCAAVAELLAVSDVCVLSSTNEGFSNSILEYMAARRAVVATDVGGAREAIIDGETGFLVPSGDFASMANRLIELLRNDELRESFGAAGRKTIEENFSADAQIDKTAALYEHLLRRENRFAEKVTA